MRRTLIIFARAPRRGTVKTRLAASVGEDEALRIYRDLGSHAADVSASGDWHTLVAFTPDDAEPDTRRWLGEHLSYAPQGSGDLGARLARSIHDALQSGAESVVVIGTDCPDLTSGEIATAFAALDGADVVLGPATDGGYYLIGLRAEHPSLFSGMTWSATNTLALTLERAAKAGLRVALLPPRPDIDTVEDLRAWQDRLAARPGRSA